MIFFSKYPLMNQVIIKNQMKRNDHFGNIILIFFYIKKFMSVGFQGLTRVGTGRTTLWELKKTLINHPSKRSSR